MWVRGSELSENLKREVLSAYIYRFTYENARRNPRLVGEAANQFNRGRRLQSDKEWLEAYSFKVTKEGKLNQRTRYARWEGV